MLGIKSLTRVLSNIADLITRTKGLNDTHDDLGTHAADLGSKGGGDDLLTRVGAFTSAQNLKAILGDLSTTKRLGQILGLDETDTLKAILGAFTAAQNLKAILGNLTTTKNLGGVLGALTTTDNLKGILGAYTTAANLKAAIDALALEATLGTHDTDIKALLAALALEASLGTHDTDIKALLAALALEASLGTHDTDIKALLSTIAGYIDAEIATLLTDTDPRVMGKKQIKEISVTSAANVGDVVLATVTTQPCIIESVVIHADGIQTGDMTSCGVFGGAGKVITFISAADAVQANLDAADKQVGWTGVVRLAATKTLVISLVGTGATAVDLTITITYRACVSGGYLA